MTEQEKQIIDNIYDSTQGNIGYACLYPNDGSERKEFFFDMTPSNIANFLGQHQYDAEKIVLTDVVDRLILDTFGGFINNCPNQELCRQIIPILVPIQMGEAEAKEFPMVSREAFDDYCRAEDEMVTAAEISML